MMSPGAVAEMEASFDDIERDLRTEFAQRLDGREARWGFERRQVGSVAVILARRSPVPVVVVP